MASETRHPRRHVRATLCAGTCLAVCLCAAIAVAGVQRKGGDASRERSPAKRSAQVQVDVNRPRNVFECDTPKGEAWYGSTERCLRELCVGGNFTNQYVDAPGGRLRKNPCYGRDPYELER